MARVHNGSYTCDACGVRGVWASGWMWGAWCMGIGMDVPITHHRPLCDRGAIYKPVAPITHHRPLCDRGAIYKPVRPIPSLPQLSKPSLISVQAARAHHSGDGGSRARYGLGEEGQTA